MRPIAPIDIQSIQPVPGDGGSKTQKTDLGDAFAKALSDARGLEKDAASQAERFAQGDPAVGIHEVVIASEKANISVRYATTLKNKAIEAYRELMNTQV